MTLNDYQNAAKRYRPGSRGRIAVCICNITTAVIVYVAGSGCSGQVKNEPVLISEILLETTDESVFSEITDFGIDARGNLLVLDWRARNVLVFDNRGGYLRKIGGRGQGPGEMSEPISFDIASNGDIYVNDQMVMCIHIFDGTYAFKRVIRGNKRLHRNILVGHEGDIFLYDGKRPFTGDARPMTIQHVDSTGVLIEAFAQLEKEVMKINFITSRNGAVFDDDENIWIVHPLYYAVRKCRKDGEEVFYKKPRSRLYHLVENPAKIPVQLNGPFNLGQGRIAVQIEGHLDVFDGDGDKIVDEIPFPEKIICSADGLLYTAVWPYERGIDLEDNPTIKVYRLSW